jgi:hypothetical protein
VDNAFDVVHISQISASIFWHYASRFRWRSISGRWRTHGDHVLQGG